MRPFSAISLVTMPENDDVFEGPLTVAPNPPRSRRVWKVIVSNFIRNSAAVAAAVIVTAAARHGAGAQTARPRPSPSPVPTPIAFTAHAHADVTVDMQGGSAAGSLQLGIAQRANLTRIEILGVRSDTVPIPPLAFTAVLDRGANTITTWNDATRQYRVQQFLVRTASPSPVPSALPRTSPAPRRGTSPFANLDVLALTVKLIGHTTTAGLPTTGLSFDLRMQRKSDKMPSNIVATAQLADEFPFFPVTLDLLIEPGMVPFAAKLSYALDDLSRETPAAERFTVPPGYTEARSLSDVIFPRRSRPSPSPLPSPR